MTFELSWGAIRDEQMIQPTFRLPRQFFALSGVVFVALSSLAESPDLATDRDAAIVLVEESLVKILDDRLRSASKDMLDLLREYEPPEDPTKSEAMNDRMEAALDLCIEGRRVFAYYERYQVRYGEEASSEIRPTMTSLFEIAAHTLKWVKSEADNADLYNQVRYSISRKLHVLRTNEPIPSPESMKSDP